MAGRRKRTERPKSPCTAWLMNVQYCAGQGRSSPRYARSTAMSASEASGGAMIWMGSPENRTSAKTTIETTNIETRACTRRPRIKRCTPRADVPRRSAGPADQLVVRFGGNIGQRLPVTDLPGHGPGQRLHPQHHAVVAIVELLAQVARQLRTLLGVEFPHGHVDLFVEGAVEEQVEGGLGVDHPLPTGHRLVVGRRAVDGEGLVALAQPHLGPKAAGGFRHTADLDPEILPVERHGLHHVRAVLGDELHVGIHPHLEAAGVTGLAQELLGPLGIVGRDLPVRAVALVERIVVVRERNVAAPTLPETGVDSLLFYCPVKCGPN